MKRAIIIRIALGYVAAVAVLSLLTYFFAFGEIKTQYTRSAERNMDMQIGIVRDSALKLYDSGTAGELIKLIENASLNGGSRLTVIRPDGTVMADSVHDPVEMENHSNRPEVIAALSGNRGVSVRYSRTLKKEMIYVAVPLAAEGKNAVLRASVPLSEISELTGKLGARIILIAVFALLAGIVAALLYDAFEVKRLETIKKDFVANVSHELRTPLAAIKGYAETLQDGLKTQDEKHYVEIIVKNTERLINIVADLLTLSRLEDKKKKIGFEDVAIADILKNTVKIFEQQAALKKLSVKLEIHEKLPVVKGDTLKFEQVFVNLVDNAIKYTEAGRVEIRAAPENGGVKVEISDTGIGIPAEHMDRIFERFYVVDKSRSRKAGGTGLGLSIVKHIMKQYKGIVEVESKPGSGTKFTLYFKGNHIN